MKTTNNRIIVTAGNPEAQSLDTLTPQRVICVLGMHRSGTSCLTGTLEDAGIFLGNVSRRNPHNSKGNCENMRIMELHEDLLRSNGGSWFNPPEKVVWHSRHKRLRDSIVAEYKEHPIWAFKDPRLLFVLEGWIEALQDLHFIGTFRHPLLVAQSLQRRDNSSIMDGMVIWKRYNSRLLHYHGVYGFPVIQFDADAGTYKRKVLTMLQRIGVHATIDSMMFYDAQLKHDDIAQAVTLPDDIADVYELLKGISE